MIAALILAIALGAATATPAGEAARVVDAVQARLDATHDFTADVTQRITLVSTGQTLEAEGRVAFKKPGRMRWEFPGEPTSLIVADGQAIWLYQPDEHQVLRAPFEQAFRSSTPISFLTGVGELAEDFTARLVERTDDAVTLALTPRRGEGELGHLALVVDAATYDIRAAEIRDPLGNVTRLELSGVQRNVGLDDARFAFERPPGTDVIETPLGF